MFKTFIDFNRYRTNIYLKISGQVLPNNSVTSVAIRMKVKFTLWMVINRKINKNGIIFICIEQIKFHRQK